MFEASAFWLVCCGLIHVSSSSFARSKFAVEASKVQNVSVALLHSVVMFFGAVKYLWPRKQLSLDLFSIPSVQPNTSTENFYCEIMIGYLLYDVVCSVQQGEGLIMLLHHVLGLASHSSMRYCNIGGPYMMWVHFAEVRRCALTRLTAQLTSCAPHIGLYTAVPSRLAAQSRQRQVQRGVGADCSPCVCRHVLLLPSGFFTSLSAFLLEKRVHVAALRSVAQVRVVHHHRVRLHQLLLVGRDRAEGVPHAPQHGRQEAALSLGPGNGLSLTDMVFSTPPA